MYRIGIFRMIFFLPTILRVMISLRQQSPRRNVEPWNLSTVVSCTPYGVKERQICIIIWSPGASSLPLLHCRRVAHAGHGRLIKHYRWRRRSQVPTKVEMKRIKKHTHTHDKKKCLKKYLFGERMRVYRRDDRPGHNNKQKKKKTKEKCVPIYSIPIILCIYRISIWIFLSSRVVC